MHCRIHRRANHEDSCHFFLECSNDRVLDLNLLSSIHSHKFEARVSNIWMLMKIRAYPKLHLRTH